MINNISIFGLGKLGASMVAGMASRMLDSNNSPQKQMPFGSTWISVNKLTQLVQRMNEDPETYFLSAESHNRWRGALSYNRFPMRVCVASARKPDLLHQFVELSG